jgi:hypothetical protein
MFKKAKVDGSIIDVISHDQYAQNPSNYPNNMTGIEMPDGVIYPIRGKTDTRPGMYNAGLITKYVRPTREEAEEYSNRNVIDFNDVNHIQDIIEKKSQLDDMEKSALMTTSDNIMVLKIKESDEPEMVLLKTAINMKKVEKENYRPRLEPNSNNNFRLVDNPSITMPKIKVLGNAFDLKISLTIEDKHPNVANPMGHPISIELTGGESY